MVRTHQIPRVIYRQAVDIAVEASEISVQHFDGTTPAVEVETTLTRSISAPPGNRDDVLTVPRI